MIKYIFKLFLFLQIIFIFSWFSGKSFLPLKEAFLGRGLGELTDQPLIWSRANFDGFYYAKIARDGYQYLQQAFFPFYPRLIELLQPIFQSFIVSGIFISSLFFIFCLWLLAKILKEEGEKEETIKKTLLFLVLFPTSFYFISVYTESLFFFLVLLVFWLAKKKKWFWVGLVAGLASYTRLVGIFLFPALVYEYYEGESKRRMKERVAVAKKTLAARLNFKYLTYFFKSRRRHIKNLFFISLSSWGLLGYMSYLQKTMQDYFYFIKVQSGFGAQRDVSRIIMIYQVFWRYLKMILTVNFRDPIYFTIWLELLVSSLFLILLVLAWWKFKLRQSWLVFSVLAYILPTLTGTFSSMPRYALVCFPCFLVLAKLKLPKWVYPVSGGLLLLCSALFVRGYWIG